MSEGVYQNHPTPKDEGHCRNIVDQLAREAMEDARGVAVRLAEIEKDFPDFYKAVCKKVGVLRSDALESGYTY